jgi:hypothetical protein
MVDGVYYGRGDTTRTRLSDAEVERHHLRRRSTEERGLHLLEVEVARDPIPEDRRGNGHMYLVAQPLTAPLGLARDLVRQDSSVLYEILQRATVPAEVQQWAPTPGYAAQRVRRAEGTAMSNGMAVGPGRQWDGTEESLRSEHSLLDVEFREDGGIRVLLGRMTDWRSGNGQAPFEVITDGLAVAYCHRLVGWALALADAVGYRGAWLLAFAGDRLRGKASSVFAEPGFWDVDNQTYDSDTYRAVTTAVRAEMEERPAQVAERLVGRLIRGLGTWPRYGPMLS